MNKQKQGKPRIENLPVSLLALGIIGSLFACNEVKGSGEGSPDDSESGGEVVDLDDDVVPVETAQCTSPAESFEQELYVPVFSKCIGCHNEYGMAVSMGSSLRLEFPESSEFSTHNVAILTEFAQRTTVLDGEEVPLLLAKPTAAVGHIGGEVLSPEGNHARLLADFVQKLVEPPDCEPPPDSAHEAVSSLSVSSFRETYARAHRLLTGTSVDESYFAALEESAAGLDGALTELMGSDAFRKRLAGFYGDALLPMANGPINVNNDILDRGGWPSNNYFEPPCGANVTNICCSPEREACCFDEGEPDFCEAGRQHTQTSIAYEPLAFIEAVTEQGLPITEILTREQAIMNPYTAAISGLDAQARGLIFDDDPSNDVDEWVFSQIAATTRNQLQTAFGRDVYPHAGILSTSSMLARYYSTESNLHRTRAARLVFEHMLDIDVKKFADFSTNVLPPDADLERATADYPACLACHAAIDPVARHFENHFNYGFFRPDLLSRIPEHFPEASYLGQQAPQDDNPVLWLGRQIAQDERFVLAMLKPILEGLVGLQSVPPPERPEDENYATQAEAFRIQRLLVREILDSLPAGPLTFPDLVRAAVRSRLFRANGSSGTETQKEALRFAGVGGGVLITPELFDSQARYLLHDATVDLPGASGDGIASKRGFRYLLGGVNWLTVEERSRHISPIALRTAERAANELACKGVARDYSFENRAGRILFKNVEWDMTPEAHEDQFRADISRLFLLFHARDVPPDDPRVDDVLDLWTAAQMRGLETVESGGLSARRLDCSFTGEGEGRRAVTDDERYIIRAWVITIAYFLTDADFLLE